MSNCSKCEAELPTGARYCNKCGSPQIPAAPTKKEETSKTTPAGISIVTPTRTIQPDTKRTPQSRAVSDNGKHVTSATPAKEIEAGQVAEETKSPVDLPECSQPAISRAATPSHASKAEVQGTPVSAPQDSTATTKTPPVLKSKIWPDPSMPTRSSDDSKSPARPGSPKATPSSVTPPDKSEQNEAAAGSVTLPDKQNKSEVIVVTPAQAAQESPRRKAAPGLIRPIGTASPKLPTNPKTPIPRRPGQLPPPPATPAPPPVTPIPQTLQAQGFTTHTPPAAFSENGGHMADQVTQQAPAQSRRPAGPPQGQIPVPLREQVISNATSSGRLYTPIENMPTRRLPREVVQAKPGVTRSPIMPERSQENLDATSRAAEHWRSSWRERQRAEAGPIMDVSRGDASVPMPLMSMQNSLVRLRAIVATNKRKQQTRGSNLSFWITIIVMICLIGGLGAYVISTYLPNSLFGAAHIAAPQGSSQPTLIIQGSQLTTLRPGQTVHLHGTHFGANDPITFLLDTVTPITNANGKALTVQTSSRGIFDVSLVIGKDWLAGTHLISAQDSRTLQSAYLNIEVGIAGTAITSSNKLALSVSELKFKAVIGQGYPGQQRVTLTNTSGAVLHWAATPIVDNNLSWLVIDDNKTSGSLNSGSSDSIGFSVLPTGLASSATPYKGQIVFTINGKEQLTLPVELQVVDAQAEVIFSPNPLTGIVNPANGTCKSGATLTLINLGSAVITWTLKPNSSAQSHISFLLNGQAATSGQLQPSGLAGDTQVLTLQCSNVHAGDTYQGTLYANSLQWPVVVLIQATT